MRTGATDQDPFRVHGAQTAPAPHAAVNILDRHGTSAPTHPMARGPEAAARRGGRQGPNNPWVGRTAGQAV